VHGRPVRRQTVMDRPIRTRACVLRTVCLLYCHFNLQCYYIYTCNN
jgi:hypothetical protein